MNEQILTEEPVSSEVTTDLSSNGDGQIPDPSDKEQDTASELELLREQVKELTRELSEKDARSQRIAAELGEFYELFPSTDIKALPEEVWESVRSGTSLAASLAL